MMMMTYEFQLDLFMGVEILYHRNMISFSIYFNINMHGGTLPLFLSQ